MNIFSTFNKLIKRLQKMHKKYKNDKERAPSHLRGLEIERFYLIRNIKSTEIQLSITLDACEIGDCCQFCAGGPNVQRYFLLESGLTRRYERLKQIDASLEKRRLKRLRKELKTV